jgi:hypothetical protein
MYDIADKYAVTIGALNMNDFSPVCLTLTDEWAIAGDSIHSTPRFFLLNIMAKSLKN